MAKFVETLQIPWPKALPLVLLNFRPTTCRTYKFSSFETVTGFPMHLAPASFDPQLIKGQILQYCKGLIAFIKNNYTLIEQYFHNALSGDKVLRHSTLQPGDFLYWIKHLQINYLQPHWRGPYQVLLTNPCATKL